MYRTQRSKSRRRNRRRGVLTLEWILLITVLVIGIIGGLGAVRNATNHELNDLAKAIDAIHITTEDEVEEIEED